MINRILIIGPSWVGDTVMAQSLFKLLKARDSSLAIDVLAPAWTFSLLARMPEIDQAFEMPIAHGELKLYQRYRLGRRFSTGQYQQAIILANSFKSALIPFFAGIARRTGWLGEMRYGLLNDVRYLNKKRYPLMVERYLALGLNKDEPLTKPYPLPLLHVTSAMQAAIAEQFKLRVHDKKPVLALCPGSANGQAKRWPHEYYANVARQKLAEGWQVWLLGSAQDQAIANAINDACAKQCINLAGQLDLAQTIDVLSLTNGVISNDSGLLHVACALEKQVLAIYGPTSPAFTPPLSSQASILQLHLACQPCLQHQCPLKHHRCMRDLLPEQVLNIISHWRGA
jgi:heptosyltransferase II